MSKYCATCDLMAAEEDFECPKCDGTLMEVGVVPPEEPEEEEAEEAPDEEASEEPQGEEE